MSAEVQGTDAGPVVGRVAEGWEPVREAFERNMARGLEVGAGVAVYHRGQPVVDLHGGWFDADRSLPYSDDALQLVFSTTKGITATALAMCVQRGLLDYDAPVADYWPEFAAAGKRAVTVAQLISHQAGLAALDEPATLEDVLDWDHMVGRLAAQAPIWEPGTAHGYHAVTFGWLAGELVRRVDPAGRSVGGFVADEIAGPLGLEAWIGAPADQEPRVSPLIPSPPPANPALAALMAQALGPDTLVGRALFLDGAFTLTGELAWNTRAVHAAELPAANAIANARSMARMYAATIGEVDGVRLLEPEIVAKASAQATAPGEADRVLVFDSTFGMGYMTSGSFTPMLGQGSFGHAGAGGSLAFAHPGHEIAFGYVMNRLDMAFNGDVRAISLVEAIKEVLAG